MQGRRLDQGAEDAAATVTPVGVQERRDDGYVPRSHRYRVPRRRAARMGETRTRPRCGVSEGVDLHSARSRSWLRRTRSRRSREGGLKLTRSRSDLKTTIEHNTITTKLQHIPTTKSHELHEHSNEQDASHTETKKGGRESATTANISSKSTTTKSASPAVPDAQSTKQQAITARVASGHTECREATASDAQNHLRVRSDNVETSRPNQKGAAPRQRRCDGISPDVVRAPETVDGSDVYPHLESYPPRSGESGHQRRPGAGTEGGTGHRGESGQSSHPAGNGKLVQERTPGGGDGESYVGDGIEACGSGSDRTGNPISGEHSDAPVGHHEVGPFWTEGCDEVCLLEGSMATEMGVIHRGYEVLPLPKPGIVGPLVSARCGVLSCGAGIQFSRDSSPDSTHPDGGPVPCGAEVCGSTPSSARVTSPKSDVTSAPGSIGELTQWCWSEEELRILMDEDVTQVEVLPAHYYPFGTTIEGAGRRVREARTRTQAPLDVITTNRLDYMAIAQLQRGSTAEWQEAMSWITTDRLQRELGQQAYEAPRVSRYLGEDESRLETWGVIRKGNPKMTSPVFKVPKADRSRLIVDCREVNKRLPKPGHMPLPDIHQLLDEVLAAEYAVQLDAKSYFHQFSLTAAAQEVFGVAIGNVRGNFRKYHLTVMPMGFSYAPLIAQYTSTLLLQNTSGAASAAAWIDNFVFWGTRADAEQKVDSFKRICEKVHLELKPDEARGSEMELLGTQVDLSAKRITVSMANQQKLWQAWEECKELATPRHIFRMFGRALWALYVVARQPLCLWESAIQEVASYAPDTTFAVEKDSLVLLLRGQSICNFDQKLNQFLSEFLLLK
eukprot:PhM_4_TR15898/c2_g1_i2/m.71873